MDEAIEEIDAIRAAIAECKRYLSTDRLGSYKAAIALSDRIEQLQVGCDLWVKRLASNVFAGAGYIYTDEEILKGYLAGAGIELLDIRKRLEKDNRRPEDAS